MQEDEVLKIAIAETSMIVRSGLALVLKRIQGLKILPIELVSEESLDECVRFHKPEILIVNPSFTGYFDVRKFKETPQNAGVKCIALMCSVADQGVLRNYDESLTIYDDADTIREKLNRLLNVPGDFLLSASRNPDEPIYSVFSQTCALVSRHIKTPANINHNHTVFISCFFLLLNSKQN